MSNFKLGDVVTVSYKSESGGYNYTGLLTYIGKTGITLYSLQTNERYPCSFLNAAITVITSYEGPCFTSEKEVLLAFPELFI